MALFTTSELEELDVDVGDEEVFVESESVEQGQSAAAVLALAAASASAQTVDIDEESAEQSTSTQQEEEENKAKILVDPGTTFYEFYATTESAYSESFAPTGNEEIAETEALGELDKADAEVNELLERLFSEGNLEEEESDSALIQDILTDKKGPIATIMWETQPQAQPDDDMKDKGQDAGPNSSTNVVHNPIDGVASNSSNFNANATATTPPVHVVENEQIGTQDAQVSIGQGGLKGRGQGHVEEVREEYESDISTTSESGTDDSETEDSEETGTEADAEVDSSTTSTSTSEDESEQDDDDEADAGPFPHGSLVWVPSMDMAGDEELGYVVYPGRKFRPPDAEHGYVFQLPGGVENNVDVASGKKLPVLFASNIKSWKLVKVEKIRLVQHGTSSAASAAAEGKDADHGEFLIQ